MRAVFTIQVPKTKEKEFISNHEIRNYLNSYGWLNIKYKDLSDDEIEQKHKEFAKGLFRDMPEIAVEAVEEESNVIFGGILQDYQTKFMITRRVDGQITFRVLHPTLDRLLSSTSYIIKTLKNHPIGNSPLEMSRNRILVFERGFDDVILFGRYIPDPFLESINTNKKDLFLFLIPLAIFCVLMIFPDFSSRFSDARVIAVLKELPIILITTSIVSILGLIETFVDTRRNRILSWKIAHSEEVRGTIIN